MSAILSWAQGGFNAVFNGLSAVGSSIADNPVTTSVGPLTANISGAVVGEALSILTGRTVQLNNLVPEFARAGIREKLGYLTANLNRLTSSAISRALRINDNQFIYYVIAAPSGRGSFSFTAPTDITRH